MDAGDAVVGESPVDAAFEVALGTWDAFDRATGGHQREGEATTQQDPAAAA